MAFSSFCLMDSPRVAYLIGVRELDRLKERAAIVPLTNREECASEILFQTDAWECCIELCPAVIVCSAKCHGVECGPKRGKCFKEVDRDSTSMLCGKGRRAPKRFFEPAVYVSYATEDGSHRSVVTSLAGKENTRKELVKEYLAVVVGVL